MAAMNQEPYPTRLSKLQILKWHNNEAIKPFILNFERIRPDNEPLIWRKVIWNLETLSSDRRHRGLCAILVDF